MCERRSCGVKDTVWPGLLPFRRRPITLLRLQTKAADRDLFTVRFLPD